MKLSEALGEAPTEPVGEQKRTKLSDVTRGDKGAQPATGAGGSAVGALFRGFLHGMGDVLHGGAQIGARMGPEIGDMGRTTPAQSQDLTSRVDAAAQQRAQQYQADPQRMAHPIASGIGRVGGNIAGTAPLAMMPGGAASIPGRIGMGAAAGAMGAAAQPVTGGGDYWTEKAKQVGIGAAAGGALGGAGRMMGAPLSQAAQSAITKFPHVASLIRGTAARSPDNFNRAVVSQALDPIGVTAPGNLKAGHDLINFAADRLTDAYNKVLPRISLKSDPEFMLKGMAEIRDAGSEVLAANRGDFDSMIKKYIEKPLQESGGVLAGPALKRSESVLGRKATTYASSPDAGQRELGDALYAARESMMDAAARQNPEAAPELQRVNQAYAMFSRVRVAANRKADSEGKFTPSDLLIAARAGDKSAGKGAFAKGDAMMQALAEATKGPMSVPHVNRILTEILGGAAGAAVHGQMGGVGGAAVGAFGPEIARGAMRATQNPIARGVGRGVSGMAPAAGAGAARVGDRMKAARKVGELRSQIYSANRRGDVNEIQGLNKKLAEAVADYRKVAPAS